MVKERLELEKIADTTSPLIHFEIHRYYQNEHHGNGFYSINNLLTIKDRTYVTNLNDYDNTGTNWVTCNLKLIK